MSRLVVEAWWPLVALVPVLAFVVFASWRSASPLGARHRGVLAAARIVAMTCVAIALMRPTWLGTTTDVSVIYALDVSRSVDPAFIDAAIRWMDRADREGRPAASRFLAFADRVRFVPSAEAIRQVPLRTAQGGSAQALDPLVTDLESALDTVAGAFEPEALKRVVLMTDGNGTRGEAWRAIERLRARGVRVFPVPALVRPGQDAWVEAVDAPDELRRDEPARVTVRIQAQAATSARVRLERDGRVLGEKSVPLAAGSNEVPFTVRVPDAGAVTLTAVVQAEGDTMHDNDRLAAPVTVQPRARVLYVEGAPDSARYLRDALAANGIAVQVAKAEEAPTDLRGFDAYDAVILSDVPAPAFGTARMEALARYTRDQGGGLVFAAGANAYGEAGWRKSPLEPVLPATFEAQEKRRDLALIIVLDRSYSMKGRKLDLAKAATLGALDLLEEEHRFGVITFDSQPEATVPLARVGSKRKAEDLISRFTASGQTNIYPALQMAYRMLVDVQSKSKHVILMTDGDTQPADFQRLTKRMADAQITISTVAIGAESDRTLLTNIANWGRGRFHYAESAERVPQIFIEETQRMVNENVREEPFRAAVKREAEALRGIDFTRAPMLKGYASTKPRDRAEVWLTADAGAPLLTRWQIGLGRAVVFGSDLKNRWAADWLDWPGYGKFWSQIVRETMRRPVREGASLDVQARAGGDALVRFTAVGADGGFRNGLAPRVRVTSPGAPPLVVTLRAAGPGRYEALVPASPGQRGARRFELLDGVPGVTAGDVPPRELVRPYPEELRGRPADQGFLQALARDTGGRYAPEPKDVFAAYGESATRPRALWPWFAGAALLAWLLDLLIRRAPWLRRSLA